ncbi:MATE family efflux transporter [Spirochaetia bacterium 38H-sp]|uniref:MATE family efflux transporter n=1 Tax=Rarispira pelagica TaxID=3141764 RepID=A0ABU9UBQ8_9SPIR
MNNSKAILKNNRIDRKISNREFILNENLWKVVFYIGLPLVFYNGIKQIFNFFDILIAASMGADVVSIVSFISQIQTLLTTFSLGLGLGGGVLIARANGAGDAVKEQRLIGTVFILILLLIVIIVFLVLPFAPWVLKVFKMPDELTGLGTAIFRLELIGLIFVFINTFYFAIERARGNTKKIFYWNLLILVSRLMLSLFFIKVLYLGPVFLSVASIIAESFVFIFAAGGFFKREGGHIIRSCRRSGILLEDVREIFIISIPIFLSKFIFHYGKVVVNSMSAAYGGMAIGALGVSNRIVGLATMPTIGFQEAETTIISQNLGNNNPKRAFKAFTITCTINVILGVMFFIIMSIYKDSIIHLFSKGDPAFALEIAKVYNYERYTSLLLAVSSSVMGLLFGFGYTRVAMLLNLLRLFVFRIPPLWYMQHYTSLKTEGLGIAMLISNMMVGVSAIVAVLILIRRKNISSVDEKKIEETEVVMEEL